MKTADVVGAAATLVAGLGILSAVALPWADLVDRGDPAVQAEERRTEGLLERRLLEDVGLESATCEVRVLRMTSAATYVLEHCAGRGSDGQASTVYTGPAVITGDTVTECVVCEDGELRTMFPADLARYVAFFQP